MTYIKYTGVTPYARRPYIIVRYEDDWTFIEELNKHGIWRSARPIEITRFVKGLKGPEVNSGMEVISEEDAFLEMI